MKKWIETEIQEWWDDGEVFEDKAGSGEIKDR